MNSCTVLNKQTNEPEIFYQSNKGEIFNTLYDVLNKTDVEYKTGFITNMGEFIPKISTPIFDISTQNGQIQSYIKNGYLNGKQVAPNTYEATDSFSAELLEKELVLSSYNEYKRNGLNFEFGDFTPDISDLPLSSKVELEVADKYTKLRTNTELKTLSFSDSQLSDMINSFMKKMGFSTTSIEEYKKKYKIKFGVEPNAEALIDFQEKIIAVAEGKETVDILSEEFSHFVIELWDQNEIDRMLQVVNNTSEYIQHAENYREIYSKQISDPTILEKAVRKEVLGKMLSNSLQKEFSAQNKTETEYNLFNKLSDILKNIIQYIKNRLNPTLQSELNTMSKDIANRLYNNTLQEKLNSNIEPITRIMYSIDENTKKKVIEAVKTNGKPSIETETAIDNLLNTVMSSTIVSNKKLDEIELDNDILTPELIDVIEKVLGVEDLVHQVLAKYKKMKIPTQGFSENELKQWSIFRTSIIEKGERLNRELSDLKGSYKNIKENQEPEIVADKLIKEYSSDISEKRRSEIINNAKTGIKSIQKDTLLWYTLFGHTSKSSNLFVNILSQIINDLQAKYKINFLKDMKNYMEPLKEHRHRLLNFTDKMGNFLSGVNQSKLEEVKRQYDLDIMKKVVPDVYEEMSLEDFIEIYNENDGIPEIKDRNSTQYYSYHFEYNKDLHTQKWVKDRDKKRAKDFQDKLDLMGIDDATNDFFKILIQNRDSRGFNDDVLRERRRASSPYYENGELKSGFQELTYSEAKSLPDNKKDFVVATNPRWLLFLRTLK